MIGGAVILQRVDQLQLKLVAVLIGNGEYLLLIICPYCTLSAEKMQVGGQAKFWEKFQRENPGMDKWGEYGIIYTDFLPS